MVRQPVLMPVTAAVSADVLLLAPEKESSLKTSKPMKRNHLMSRTRDRESQNKNKPEKTTVGNLLDLDSRAAGGDSAASLVSSRYNFSDSSSQLTSITQELLGVGNDYNEKQNRVHGNNNNNNKIASKDVDNEINQKISSVYRSLESLAKKRINFNDSVRAATRRTVSDGLRNKSILNTLAATGPASLSNNYNDLKNENNKEGLAANSKALRSSRIIDVTRTYPKMFGLDPMKVIASSEEDTDEGEESVDQQDPRKKTKKSIRKYLEQLIKEEQPRDMSAIMPTSSEKSFLTKLQKRENQLNKEINDMKNNLDVMNMKAEKEANKARADRSKQKKPCGSFIHSLSADSNTKGPARELMNFSQATGGKTGGWEQESHAVFARGFQKWSNQPSKLIANLIKLLPNKRTEDIVEHIGWYEKYEKLLETNRAHIRQWRISKKRERDVIYQMAVQSQCSREESEKQKHHIRRNTERDKNKELLQEWKMQKHSRGDSLDNNTRIAKMDLELLNTKKDLQEITAVTRDLSKSLQQLRVTDKYNDAKKVNYASSSRRSRSNSHSAVSEASSGFCEQMTMEDIEKASNELLLAPMNDDDHEGDALPGSQMIGATTAAKRVSFSKANKCVVVPKCREEMMSKIILQDFKSRDDEIIRARKRAIRERKEKLRNQAMLTVGEVKERIKRISTPSKLMTPTKGWTIRKEIVDLEKIETLNRSESEGETCGKVIYHPAASVTNIPKLGTPSWRR